MKRSRPEDEAKAASGTTSSSSATTKKAKTGLGDQLARMVDNPRYADVELLVVGQEGTPVTPIYASKVILAARSPVFEALLSGSFREGQPWSSSSSSTSASVATSAASSTSLAPVFWHRAEIRDMEPRTMRHLLHCLYTDQLHPDFSAPSPSAQAKHKKSTDNDHDDEDDSNDNSDNDDDDGDDGDGGGGDDHSGDDDDGGDDDHGSDKGKDEDSSRHERDLVALYAAADCYLVDKVQTLARRELIRRFDDDCDANVLPVFDLALAVAPELATRACQSFIEARARRLLGRQDDSMEAQWLGLSDAAAARVVGMDLDKIDEIDVFDAVQRRYEHHLAEAEEPGDDHDDDSDEEGDGDGDKGKDNGDGKKRKEERKKKKEEMRKKRDAAIAEAKQKVAGLVKGINLRLLSVDELSDVVEPSGLFTDAQLKVAYKNAARTRLYVIKDLVSSRAHHLSDLLAHGRVRWSLDVQQTNAAGCGYAVNLRIKPSVESSREASPHLLSAEDVTVMIYRDRRLVKIYYARGKTVAVPGVLSVPFTARPSSGRVTIIVRVPRTAFTKAAQK
jgi:hypothetical protein